MNGEVVIPTKALGLGTYILMHFASLIVSYSRTGPKGGIRSFNRYPVKEAPELVSGNTKDTLLIASIKFVHSYRN